MLTRSSNHTLTEQLAERFAERIRSRLLQLAVVGIAGPGDPFANAGETLETLRGVRALHPDLRLCVATNGLALPEYVSELADLAVVTKAFDESINDIAGTLMNSGYSRKLEYEADAAAVEILRRAGYQPGALVAMLENMAKNWDASRKDFAATHPAPADRIKELQKAGVASSKASAASRQQRFLAATKSL